MQAQPLLAARSDDVPLIETSHDLGRTATQARLDEAGATFADGIQVCWTALQHVVGDRNGCFEVQGTETTRIQQMSDLTGRLASLYPTQGPPALLLSGTLMHRIKGIHPGQDTQHKLQPLGRLAGMRVLDTATGLGYTAIEAADAGAEVITVEWDPAVVDMERRNPWSAGLFAHHAIDRRQGDIAEVIETFDDNAFDRILHDPPVFELAGDLYGGAFYAQLHRVLAPRGRLFHYVGNLDSPSGIRVSRGASRRLGEAGFGDVRLQPDAFGISARL
ncbi:MAG TPA: spermine synthase [Candidatus Latescibacteria bacterium]|nr:spermine synthase [Candidatus Latescibacterota bacterium]